VQATDINSNVVAVRGRLAYEDADNIGGIVVQPDYKIRLIGQVGNFYELAEPIAADRFSIITFDLLGMGITNSNRFTVCLFESMSENELSCPSRCYEAQSSKGDLALKKTFRERKVSIRYIGFRQATQRNGDITETILSSINVVAGVPESIYDSNGHCIDPNARLRNLKGRSECVCNDGYSASNGGNIQGVYDVCVDCHSETDCVFDSTVTTGETCARDLMITLEGGPSSRPLKASITQVRKDIAEAESIARGGTFVHGDIDNSITLHGEAHNTFSLVTYHTIEQLSRLRFDLSILDDIIPYVAVCFLSSLQELEISNDVKCICMTACSIDHLNRPPDLHFNLALGKTATQSSTRDGAGEENAKNAVNGVKTQPKISTYNDAIFTAFETKPYWEVYLEKSYRIEAITIYKNMDISYQELIGFNVVLYDDTGEVVYYVLVDYGLGSNIVKVIVPHIVASTVRITKQSESDESMLTFVEVEVHRSKFEATTLYDIPTGQLFPGKNIEYVTFISLISVNYDSEAEATFSRIQLLYGTSPDWSESPSASSLPTVSAAPSKSPSVSPTRSPSSQPSITPTQAPTPSPSVKPSSNPTITPSEEPTVPQTEHPSMFPSTKPSYAPSSTFSPTLTLAPSALPSLFPSMKPTLSQNPTISTVPSSSPQQPSSVPTSLPSELPSNKPTGTTIPSNGPTKLPTSNPSQAPDDFPSSLPTISPSFDPTRISSQAPSNGLSIKPSNSRSSTPS
jgi:hypothetical protein